MRLPSKKRGRYTTTTRVHHLVVRGKPNKEIQVGTSWILLEEMVTLAKLKEPPNQKVSRGA